MKLSPMLRSTLSLLILVGLPLMIASAVCMESYFTIEISVRPARPKAAFAACDDEGFASLGKLFRIQINKKFEDYKASVTELREEAVTEFCASGGNTRGRGRNLALTLQSGAFAYTGASKCTYCNSDNHDGFFNYPLWLSDHELELQTTLQDRLTRVLTQKVNNNVDKSCLVDSNSTVEVTLTPVGSNPPPLVCPP